MSASETPEPVSDATGSSSWTLLTRWRGDWQWSGVVALGAVFVTFWFLAGAWGALGWLVVAAAWILCPTVVAVASGQFILVALSPAESGIMTVLPSVIAVNGLLLAEFAPASFIDTMVFAGLAVFAGATVGILVQLSGMPLAVTVMLIVFGCVSYLLHRYLLLELGLVESSGSADRISAERSVSETEQ